MKLAVAEGLSRPVIQMLVGASLSVLVWMALSPEVLTDMSGGGSLCSFIGCRSYGETYPAAF
ncbi:MAG: hypothetical protein R3E73_11470 [Porticoccaceae bacterium]